MEIIEDKPKPINLECFQKLQICFVAYGLHHTAALARGGNVFIFGEGMYGQLGHIKKKVLELPGVVTQIACGRFEP